MRARRASLGSSGSWGVKSLTKNSKWKRLLQHRLAFEVLGILSLALSVFIFASLFTYTAQDPSFLSNAKGQASNACGWVGAWISAVLLQGLGLGAFLVPASFLFVGATLHQREGWVRLTGILGGMAVAVMSLAVFVAIQWQVVPYNDTELLTGGTFGAWVSQFLVMHLNPLGASILSMLVFSIALVLSTPISVAQAVGKSMSWTLVYLWRLGRYSASYIGYYVGLLIYRLFQAGYDGVVAGSRGAWRWAGRSKGRIVLHGAPRLERIWRPLSEKFRDRTTSVNPVIGLSENDESDEEEDFEPIAVTPAAHEDNLQDIQEPEILPFEDREEAPARSKPKLGFRKRVGQWKLPTPEFLDRPPKIETEVDRTRLIENSKILKQKLDDFGIDGEVVAVRPGPVITLYEFKPGPGVKVSKIAALADDLSMALSAESVRILAPLPGKAVVGIEIPSETREVVFLREFLQQPDFYGDRFSIPLVMGKDIGGHPVISDLVRMPHLLCAGQTGSGKSVFMNSLICSLIYRFTPEELRLILVDPKFIEFRAYQDIPHLLLPVVDDPKEANTALKWAVREMERRYRILAMMGVRNLSTYNQKVEEMGADVVRDLLFAEENQFSRQTGGSTGSDWMEAFEQDDRGAPCVGKLPYIVIVIDELADLMMAAKKDVEISIARIAQKARAAGIHLMIATQRPSTDVVTGLIKANLPSRASFQLASHVDSKTILDRTGAERLLGQGDLLFIPPGTSHLLRLHAAYVSDDEIEKITAFLRSQGEPDYRDEILIEEEEENEAEAFEDALFEDAVDLVRKTRQASASYLQRHLKVGYNRAARMIEAMEVRGMVGPADGSRPRDVLM